METLGKILGNPARIKIMRLFLLNRGKGFKSKDIVQKSRVSSDSVRRELRLLASVNFIKKRSKAYPEWYFNSSFKYAEPFKDLLVRSDSLNKQKLLAHFRHVGRGQLFLGFWAFLKKNDNLVVLLIFL